MSFLDSTGAGKSSIAASSSDRYDRFRPFWPSDSGEKQASKKPASYSPREEVVAVPEASVHGQSQTPMSNCFSLFPTSEWDTESSTMYSKPEGQALYSNLPGDDCFHLLEIQPDKDDRQKFCKLIMRNILPRAPRYEALSYAWGNTWDKVNITCDGISVWITQNLFDTLHKIRLPNRPRFLWADAICINQEDMEERERQVRLWARSTAWQSES